MENVCLFIVSHFIKSVQINVKKSYICCLVLLEEKVAKFSNKIAKLATLPLDGAYLIVQLLLNN